MSSDKRFEDIVYIVQADDFAMFTLWNEYNKKVNWEQDSVGFIQNVGDFGGMPVTISVTFTKINGRRIVFYDSPSMVTDWRMVDEWIKNECPYGARFTDAMNFHHCIRYINELNTK